ncbi:hypothetical protein ACR75V_15925 [Enterococcus avium]|uniref:hypothetical protein n=1 Tax=Enterococcus avium TaxID=33945 RepID=UPI003A3C2CE6
MKPAIIGGSICHAFNPDSSLSNFLLDFLFAGLKKETRNFYKIIISVIENTEYV